MTIEFRRRDYEAEEVAHSLPRIPAQTHPLSTPSTPSHQVDDLSSAKDEFFDPLRVTAESIEVSGADSEDHGIPGGLSSKDAAHIQAKEWTSFKKILTQRFPVSKPIAISSMSGIILKSGKGNEKSSVDMHLEELDDPQKFAEEDAKVISQQDYVLCLQELKNEIAHAWRSDDRITSLKLAIKVARLLMDTSVLQFYPTLFVLATDLMDMLGELVWERIRRKAEFTEDGTFVCSLTDSFEARNIHPDARETCYNWFCKIGAVRELIPRIYLELAIYPCWRFLVEDPTKNLQRLVMMMRGISDPLASAYCRLYLVQRAEKLQLKNTGCLITCINDMTILLKHMVLAKATTQENLNGKLLFSLVEPTIGYTIKCILRDSNQMQVREALIGLGLGRNQSDLFGSSSCISVVVHHLVKELPSNIICLNALEILHLIERTDDISFDKCLNYKLLGFRLYEGISQVNEINSVVDKVIQVLSCFENLDQYLMILDAYVDIIFQNDKDKYVAAILGSIYERVCSGEITENTLASLQSIFLKLVAHFNSLDSILALNPFIEILDMMHGSSRNTVNMHILLMSTGSGCIQDPKAIYFLFEVSQALHDGLDFSNVKSDERQQAGRLIARFVNLVDFGPELERELTFLQECRGAFHGINELKESLVHSANLLAIKAMRDTKCHPSFVKSCLAFTEATLPSIPSKSRQLTLYLEAAEVALMGGLISHSNELIDSATSCLRSFDIGDGSKLPSDADGVLTLTCKLCSLMIMVPGNLDEGVTYVPKILLSLVNLQSWMSPRMKVMLLCGLVLMSAALGQNSLLYHAVHEEVIGNDVLFFEDPTYSKELTSFCQTILQSIVNVVLEEPSQAVRGSIALDACNCIASSFEKCEETSAICNTLLETAKSCLSTQNKYLQSTMQVLDRWKLLSNSRQDHQ